MEPLGRYVLAGGRSVAHRSAPCEPRACSASSSEPGIVLSLRNPRLGWPTGVAAPCLAGRPLGAPAVLVDAHRAPIIATALMSVAWSSSVVSGAFLPWPRSSRSASLSSPPGHADVVAGSTGAHREPRTRSTRAQRFSGSRCALAAKRPLAGHGYSSFDEVTNTVGRTLGFDAVVLYEYEPQRLPDHLVEYGASGSMLFVLPLLVFAFAAISGAVRPSPASGGSWSERSRRRRLLRQLAANDFRFFSLAQALPWMFARAHLRTRLRRGGLAIHVVIVGDVAAARTIRLPGGPANANGETRARPVSRRGRR